MRLLVLICMCFVLGSCKTESKTLDTSNISMRVYSQVLSNSRESEVFIDLEDYSSGPPGYLTILPKVELSTGDSLVLTSDGQEYPARHRETGVYSALVPTRLPGTYGVELRRTNATSATMGQIELIGGIEVTSPISGQVYRESDEIIFNWVLSGGTPVNDVHNFGPQNKLELIDCTDASGKVVHEPDEYRRPAPPLPVLASDERSSSVSASKVLFNAVGPDALEEKPSIQTCRVKIDLYYDNFHSESSAYARTSTISDTALARQKWSFFVRSNPIILEIHK